MAYKQYRCVVSVQYFTDLGAAATFRKNTSLERKRGRICLHQWWTQKVQFKKKKIKEVFKFLKFLSTEANEVVSTVTEHL